MRTSSAFSLGKFLAWSGSSAIPVYGSATAADAVSSVIKISLNIIYLELVKA